MRNKKLWKKFMKSGSINDYLEYVNSDNEE